MNRVALLAVLVGCAGCSKKPSVAQPAFEQFIDSVGHLRPDKSFTSSGATLTPLNAGEPKGTLPTDGEVHFPAVNVGRFGWTKFTPESETKTPSGDLLLGVRTELCMRADTPDDNAVCNRPNVYGFKVLMRNEGGTWKVAGAAFSDEFIVR